MKKFILAAALLFSVTCAFARDYTIIVDENIPQAASELLVQRFTQMFEAAGHKIVADSTPVQVSGTVTNRMETPGSMSQTALNIEVKAECDGAKVVFPLTGVGEDEADAWLRAVKRLLPRSKEAQAFMKELQ